ncbi:MAG: AAA family ATPase [Pirellulaceae bacterium]
MSENSNNSDFAPLKRTWNRLRGELGKSVVGQDDLIEQLFIAILAGGHCLVKGMPGVAKALVAATFAQALGLSFHRIRCSPDLSPNDVAADHIPATGNGEDGSPSSRLLAANVLLVDGVERLPPKTLSLVYQALQDREILARGELHRLPDPFLLLASSHPEDEDAAQNPSELRDDRFMFQIRVDYPSYHDEYQVAETMTATPPAPIEPLASPAEIGSLRKLVRTAGAPAHTLHYVLRLVRSTRVHEGENPDFVYEWVRNGAGPRAVHFMTQAAKIRAAINGRSNVSIEDIRAVAHPVLRHRVLTNRNAQSTGITVERVIQRLLADVPERVDGDNEPPQAGDTMNPQEWSTGDTLPW